MHPSLQHIAQGIQQSLPSGKQEASWGLLAEQFPWYGMLHLLRAAEHPEDDELFRMARLHQPNIIRLQVIMQPRHVATQAATAAPQWQEPAESSLPQTTPETPVAVPDNTPNPAADNAQPPLEGLAEIPDATAEQTGLAAENDLPPAEGEVKDSTLSVNLSGFAEMLKSPVAADEMLPLQAYHTIDYFASQGIKAEKGTGTASDTALDRQVKSFTEWLKTMKKLKYQPATAYTDPLVETKAKTSLNRREIVTEAMAEVWEKQGNMEEAARVYAKLMLQYPEKTPYFASRLKELKEKQ